MSERKQKRWEIAGLFFVLLVGNLLHFVYAWSGNNPIVAAFAATNESTWEHMKLFAVPWSLWSLLESAALRREKAPVLAARGAGLLAGLLVIPTVFYTYRGIWGVNIDWVNILIFQLAVLLAFWLSRQILKGNRLRGTAWQAAGLLVLLAVWGLFIVWSYLPPVWPIFTDPVTGLPGI